MNGYDNNIERLYNYFGVKTKRLTIADSEGNTRMEGDLNIQQNADNTEVWYLLPFKDYRAVVLATFYSDGESIFKDVTDNYKKTYPHIKKGRATSHLRNRGIGAGQIIDRSKDYIYIWMSAT